MVHSNTIRSLVARAASITMAVAGFTAVPVRTQTVQPPDQVDPAALQWPRFYATNGYEFAVYQPQISSWPGNELNGRLVVAVRPTGTSNETYGIVSFQARTDIDKVNRLVTLDNFQINRVDFPGQKEKQDQFRDLLLSFRRQSTRVIPLDHLEAVFAASADSVNAKVEAVKNDAPQIFYATAPALLILVQGAPVLKDISGDFQRVINTRAILFFDKNPQAQAFYLYADNQWYSAPAIAGPWMTNANPPSGIDSALSAAFETKQVDPLYPRNQSAPTVSQVFVSTSPAELLETSGDPNMVSVPGTELLYVENTSNAIFFYPASGSYYVLLSGRWFHSTSLQGPWAFVASDNLPADFKRIPADSEKSNVLLSVAGTPQAQEAVIANSIPQTATIQRDQASLNVTYYGAPGFSPIAGTSLSYATNSPTPVIMVSSGSYYACQGGVWFAATSPAGPWSAATTVPPDIYTIPASCPIHYVTYAYVYGSTPTNVDVGYTPGYMGTVVAPGNVVVYGTGYDYGPMIAGDTCVTYPPTYGYGASFALGAAVGYSVGYCAGVSSTCCCEPYWGCYYWAAPSGYSYAYCNVNACNLYSHWGTAVTATGSYGYNPYTGNAWASRTASTFNPYTGTRGTVSSTATYNPYTGNAAASRGGSWYNPYTGRSASANASGNFNTQSGQYSGNRQVSANNAATGRYVSSDATVSGNAYNGTESASRSGTAGNTASGNSVSWNNGSITADKNGNMYAYNQAGTQRYNASSGAWESATREVNPNAETAYSPATRLATSEVNPNAETAYSPAMRSATSESNWANRQYNAQAVGAQRYDNWRGSGGGGWGGGGVRRR